MASKENIEAIEINFVCLHLEELVGLACSAATASSDEHELYALQEVGIRLLQVDTLALFFEFTFALIFV